MAPLAPRRPNRAANTLRPDNLAEPPATLATRVCLDASVPRSKRLALGTGNECKSWKTRLARSNAKNDAVAWPA
eukprot:11195146-Lingulodinium_polyedra.AAC.1